MQVKIVIPLESQLPGFMLCTFGVLLLASLASSADPCPPASKLSPCWCTDFPLNWRRTTVGVTTTSTPQPTTTLQPDNTSLRTSTSEPTERKRRHVKRQIATFSAFSRTAYYTEVTCNFTTTVHDLEEAIGKGLERRWVDKVTISNHRPSDEDVQVRMPDRLFRNTRLKQVKITHTILAGDFINSGDPFDGQAYSLMWFTVNYCFLRGQLSYSDTGTVQTMGLNKLTKLQGLDLSNNELEYVRDSAFRSPPANLTTLILSYNKIRVLDIGVFQKLTNLRKLDLSHNHITSLRKTMLPPNGKRLNYIDFSWNSLTVMPPDFFTNMPALKTLNVSHNFMYSMPSNPWAGVWRQLQFLDITGNYLSCDCSLKWLPALLWPSEGNGTTAASLTSSRSQTMLGYCSAYEHDSYPELYALVNLTDSSLDC